MDRPKRGPDRQLAFRCDLSRQSLSLAQQILRRDDLREEAQGFGLLGRDKIPGQDQLGRLRASNQPTEALRGTESRDNPEVDLRLAESCSFRSKADVATDGQLQATTQADPVNRRDDGSGTGLDLVEDRLSPQRHLRPFTGG